MDDSTRLKVYQYLEAPLLSPGRVIFPSRIDKLLCDLAATEMGPDWTADPDVAAWLKPAFAEAYQDTLDAAVPAWTQEKYLASLLGMGPFHFHKVPIALREMLRAGPIGPPALKVLDVGAGPGIASLSLLYFFELYVNALDVLDVMGAEGSVFVAFTPLDATKEGLETYKKLIYSYVAASPRLNYELMTPLNVAVRDSTSVREMLGDEKYDIILLSHVHSEMRDLGLDRRAQVVVDLAGSLTPGGLLIMIETSTAGGIQSTNQLKSRIVSKGLDLYGPCTHVFGKPAGPICFTCPMSRREEVAPPAISQAFCSVVGGAGLRDLAGKNQWTYAIFRSDGLRHHGHVPVVEEQIPRIVDIAKRKTGGRGTFYVQIARKEADPFLYYRVCDQSAKSDECYLTFETPAPPRCLEIGTLLELKNVRIDFAKRPGGEAFRNSFYFVVDAQSEVVDRTAQAKSLPTRLL